MNTGDPLETLGIPVGQRFRIGIGHIEKTIGCIGVTVAVIDLIEGKQHDLGALGHGIHQGNQAFDESGILATVIAGAGGIGIKPMLQGLNRM